MNAFKAIFKRELKSYFSTPVAYVFLVVFIALASFLTFNTEKLLETGDANMLPFFKNLPLLFSLFAPAIAMKMWAEERRTGTIELLFTLPVSTRAAILGKFVAGWAFFGIALLLTLPIAFWVSHLGDPDWGPILSGYFGAFLMAGTTLSIGCFFSAITKNQVISFIVAAIVCALIAFAGQPQVLSSIATWAPKGLIDFIESISFSSHFAVMKLGVIEFRNMFYLLTLSAGFLYATKIVLEHKKA